jgi:hypothetical protein
MYRPEGCHDRRYEHKSNPSSGISPGGSGGGHGHRKQPPRADNVPYGLIVPGRRGGVHPTR